MVLGFTGVEEGGDFGVDVAFAAAASLRACAVPLLVLYREVVVGVVVLRLFAFASAGVVLFTVVVTGRVVLVLRLSVSLFSHSLTLWGMMLVQSGVWASRLSILLSLLLKIASFACSHVGIRLRAITLI